MVDPQQIMAARSVVNSIYIDDRVKDYIFDDVSATREPATLQSETGGLVRLRRIAARNDLSCAGRACTRVPERTRIRHAPGY